MKSIWNQAARPLARHHLLRREVYNRLTNRFCMQTAQARHTDNGVCRIDPDIYVSLQPRNWIISLNNDSPRATPETLQAGTGNDRSLATLPEFAGTGRQIFGDIRSGGFRCS